MTTVLVVDDESDIRLLARLILEPADCTVLEAADGTTALATISSTHVDLVLLDLRMPVLDGWGVLRQLRADGCLPDLPVVVVSAHADPAMVEAVMAEGCRGYVQKPFQPSDLMAAVEDATAQHPQS